MLLTDLSVRALKAPLTGQKTFFDATLNGFGVRVSAGGTKTFVLMYGRARRLTTIGRVGIISLKEARDKARTILAQRTLGAVELPKITFGDALSLFLDTHGTKLKASTKAELKHGLERHFLPKWRHDQLATITTADISAVIDRLHKTPSEAAHAYAKLRQFFGWATERSYLDRSPMERLRMPHKYVPRQRVLSDEELRAVYLQAAADGDSYGKLVRLLILLAQRIRQISHLRGEYIDRKKKLIEWPPALMKSNRTHVIPYGDMVAEIINTLPEIGLCFPARGKIDKPMNGFSALKAALDKRAGVLNYTHHDFRRTMRTGLASLRIPREHAERLLDHRSATMTDVEAIYDRFEYRDEMREAIEAWEGKVRKLIEQRRAAA
jgi:hypothetical protein